MRCVYILVGKKKLTVKLEDGQNKDIGYSSLVFLSSKEGLRWMTQYQIIPKKKKVDC